MSIVLVSSGLDTDPSCLTAQKSSACLLCPGPIVGSGRLAEHNAKKPDGTEYLKSPLPFSSLLPPAVIAPAGHSRAHLLQDSQNA